MGETPAKYRRRLKKSSLLEDVDVEEGSGLEEGSRSQQMSLVRLVSASPYSALEKRTQIVELRKRAGLGSRRPSFESVMSFCVHRCGAPRREVLQFFVSRWSAGRPPETF